MGDRSCAAGISRAPPGRHRVTEIPAQRGTDFREVEGRNVPVRSSTPEQRKKRLQGLRRYFWLATVISVLWIAVALWALLANAAATKSVAYLQLGAAIVWGFVAWRGYVAARRFELENADDNS